MTDREELEQAITALEAQRATLGDVAVDAAIAGLREKLRAPAATRAPASPRAWHGERKLVTVMFADISGFTAMSERMDPEAVRALMNACFEHLVPIIKKYDGTIDKFIGDEIMALFGAPVAHENDPERALRAAIEVFAALEAFNAAHSTGLGIHFGINKGFSQLFGISHDDTFAQDMNNIARVVKESGASRVKSFINEMQANSADAYTGQIETCFRSLEWKNNSTSR